ncbi:MAG TPA: isoamylase early set domain-containing protein [Longimicrobiales bacterium]
MHPDLQRYLDGEISADALPPELRQEAREWDTLLDDALALPRESAPAWLESRVMASLPPLPGAAGRRAARREGWGRAFGWLLRPQAITLRPATVLAGAAALAGVLALWPRTTPAPGAGGVAAVAPATPPASEATSATNASGPAQASVVYVQFTLTAPTARSVEVAGDFNGWQPQRAELRDPEGDGVWSAMIPVAAGVHKYMFVIDGRRWVSDPHAHRFVDDGFGMKNSLIAVAPPTRSS